MVLDDPIEWRNLIAAFPQSARFVADPRGVPPARWPTLPRGGAVVLAVGPEGGFTSAERELAHGSGWLTIRYSLNTLRIETAGLAGCAALLARVPEVDE